MSSGSAGGNRGSQFPKELTHSARDFISLVHIFGCINCEWQRRWGLEDPGACFRGVDKESYDLNPGLLRPPHFQGMLHMGLRENNLWQEFRRRSVALLGRSIRAAWESMCVMQQHGLPTRLLDWSRALLVGAYFAVRDVEDTDNGAVWVMAAKHLLEIRGIPRAWHLSIESPQLDGLALRDNDEGLAAFNAETPLVLDPDRLVPRLVAQKAVYTVHSFSRFALEELAVVDRAKHGDACFLHKIVIPAAEKTPLRSALFVLGGISEESLFPDMDGFARDYVMERKVIARGELGPEEVHCRAVESLRPPITKDAPAP